MRYRGADTHVLIFFTFYVLGLLLSEAGPFSFSDISGWCLCIAVILFLIGLGWEDCRRSGRCFRIETRGILLCFLSCLGGFLQVCLTKETLSPYHHIRYMDSENWLVELLDFPEEKDRTYRLEVEICAVKPSHPMGKEEREGGKDRQWFPVEGKALLYIRKDSLVKDMEPGQYVFVHARMDSIVGFYDKDGDWFDYGAFMRRRGFYTQTFIDGEQYWVLKEEGENNRKDLRLWMLQFRKRILLQIDEAVESADEASVIKALVLGERGNRAVEAYYRDTGIVHVLAVSGMHLSVFACMAVGFLSFLEHRSWMRLLRILLLLTLVWGYAFLTGFSSSVARAAVMFSLLSLAKFFHRKCSMGRSLLFSAWGLLVWDSDLLYDLGFLLSYSAVVGLVFLSPRLRVLKLGKRWLGKYISSQLVASLAAQMATMPIILLTFGTFPTYFLLANLLICPIATVALPWGLLACFLLHVYKPLGTFSLELLRWPVWLMNTLARGMASFPNSILPMSVSILSVVLIYLLLYWFQRGRNSRLSETTFGCLACLIMVVWIG